MARPTKPTAAPTLPWTAEQTSRNVHTVRLNVAGPKWESWFLLTSDQHHDNPHCNRDLEYRHLKQAVERKAGIISAGDTFDCMGGKWDKRADKNNLRPEHQTGDYLDALVRTTAEDYAPYARNWIVLGTGNHETAMLRAHESDLVVRLAERLNAKTGSRVQAGGYSGWVRFMFRRGSKQTTRLLMYYHGTGGGGPVTRGVIQTNRMAVNFPDAHILLTGHTHDHYMLPIARNRINDAGTVYRDEQIHLRCSSYKDGFADGHGGYEVERGHNPKPIGAAVWLKFSWDHASDNPRMETFRA